MPKSAAQIADEEWPVGMLPDGRLNVVAPDTPPIELVEPGEHPADLGYAGYLDAASLEDALRPRTLYIYRQVLNAGAIKEWAKEAGFPTTVAPGEMHVTICYSKKPVNWMDIDEGAVDLEDIHLPASNKRLLEEFGDNACVLVISASQLSWRHEMIKQQAGASWDHPEYAPHITLTYEKPEGLDVSKITPYRGEIVLGPEVWEEIEPNHKSRMAAEDVAARDT